MTLPFNGRGTHWGAFFSDETATNSATKTPQNQVKIGEKTAKQESNRKILKTRKVRKPFKTKDLRTVCGRGRRT